MAAPAELAMSEDAPPRAASPPTVSSAGSAYRASPTVCASLSVSTTIRGVWPGLGELDADALGLELGPVVPVVPVDPPPALELGLGLEVGLGFLGLPA